MREILFRGKCLDNNEWVEGFFVNLWMVHYKTHESLITDVHTGHSYNVDINTVGQFTGLSDKNGKKIFEGDIIDASNEWWDAAGYAGHDSPIILVRWNNGECGFSPFSTYDSDCGVEITASRCEVIGNIYDNPEIEWCN